MAMQDIIGTIAATLTTSCFIPQALRVVRTRHTKDISLSMYIMFCSGVLCWLVYGWIIKSWPVVIANGITLPLALIILYTKVQCDYLNNPSQKP